MTTTSQDVLTIPCDHCGKPRSADQRHPCPHCRLRRRDRKVDAETKVEGQDLVVIASNPDEMVGAQRELIARLDVKIVDAQREVEAAEAVALPVMAPETESATAKQLVAAANERLVQASHAAVVRAKRRVVYLQKVRAALEAGYVMMPNFPGHVIAVRTNRKGPPKRYLFGVSGSADAPVAKPDYATPPGEGKYVHPTPAHTHDPQGQTQDIIIHGWEEEIGLPVEFLKPEVVRRTAEAIDLKIFDEIVLVRDGAHRDTHAGQESPPRGRDPMVMGRVILRTGSYDTERRVLSFLIAWFFDSKLI